jgi:CheY-like chemotaxis protein
MTGKRILVVDDERQVVSALSRLLRRHGFTVESAHSGAEALSILERFDPHVVITDYRMPGMNGAEVLRQVRSLRPQARRFLISGYTEVAGGMMLEIAHGLIPKPWDHDALIELMRGFPAERS